MPMQSIKSHCVDIDVSKSRANILVCIELHVTVHKCALNQISLHTDIDVNKHSHCAFNRTPLYTYLQPIESPRIHHRKYLRVDSSGCHYVTPVKSIASFDT